MNITDGGITAARGFEAAGIEVGIKENHSGKKDMAMIFSKTPCKGRNIYYEQSKGCTGKVGQGSSEQRK